MTRMTFPPPLPTHAVRISPETNRLMQQFAVSSQRLMTQVLELVKVAEKCEVGSRTYDAVLKSIQSRVKALRALQQEIRKKIPMTGMYLLTSIEIVINSSRVRAYWQVY